MGFFLFKNIEPLDTPASEFMLGWPLTRQQANDVVVRVTHTLYTHSCQVQCHLTIRQQREVKPLSVVTSPE